MDRMHSLRASSDLLISAPSILVFFSFSAVSEPFSLPARSMKDSCAQMYTVTDACGVLCEVFGCTLRHTLKDTRLRT